MRRYLIPILLALAGAALAWHLGMKEFASVKTQLTSFPDSDAPAHRLRPLILGGLCFLPAIGGLCYAMGGTLARYVAREFLGIFGLCFCGLFLIWLIADLNDNLDDLRESGRAGALAWKLYSTRLPEVTVMMLPYSLLLSLLYSLGRFSRSREIVAMIQTGRGLARLTTPFLIAGFLSALLCAGLNYHWAPQAMSAEKAVTDEAKGRHLAAAEYVRYRNSADRRLWMVGSFPTDYQRGAPLVGIFVVQENPDGSLRSILSAESAAWSPDTRDWTFHRPLRRHLKIGEATVFERDLPDPLVIRGWKETPAELIRPGLPAEELGIPELQGWLDAHRNDLWARRSNYLTQWHSRWAQPFGCLIVVLLATPLGVVFTRRGTSGGVAMAIFLSAGMMFLSTVSVSLGDAGHLQPSLAAWLPNIVFGVLAIYLFHRRLAGQPIYQTLRKFIPSEA